MDLLDWIDENLKPAWRREGSFLYEGVESQSGRCLPLIYQPFDAGHREHWADRGAAHDFVATAGRGRLLDVGPGDGWPSLIVAPYVEAVDGVDAAEGLVEVQRENAARLGIDNVSFHHLRAGAPLPFADGTFDGAMASSSLEQTEDPRATLDEIRRVLKPGARLRIYYEALGQYRGRERQAWLFGRRDGTCLLSISSYDVEQERAHHVRLHLAAPASDVSEHLGAPEGRLVGAQVTPAVLAPLLPVVLEARGCTLTHPSGPTLARWMRDVGFREARGTHSGRDLARRVFDGLDPRARPTGIEGVDGLLAPVVPAVTTLEAPLETDPMITAVR